MADEKQTSLPSQLTQLLKTLLSSQWLEILINAWKTIRKLLREQADEGVYEVLEYETTLELMDKQGKRAKVRKRQKVRYLQNNILAYQDQAWGDGKILINYRCTPGKPVDRYRPGSKTYILISLREVKHRGDIDEFNIQWGIQRGFLRSTELWETEISHRTKKVKVQVIFPRTRPPRRVAISDSIHQDPPQQPVQVRLPDGRWSVSWEMDQPRLYERYLLKWDW